MTTATIKLDMRETECKNACQRLIDTIPKFQNLTLVSSALPLGDAILTDHEGNDCVIIERKTLADLAASIKDGRYAEQSYRLNGIDHPNHNIVYLIEGDKIRSFRSNGMDCQTLYSAMFSIQYFKGFSLMRSANLEETAMMLCNMACKLINGLKEGKRAYYTNPNLKEGEDKEEKTKEEEIKEGEEQGTKEGQGIKDYCSVVKRVKKDNITKDNIGEIMLCQIPHVSSVSAMAILSVFHTLPNLIKEIHANPACLQSVVIPSTNRKLSKTVISNVVAFLS